MASNSILYYNIIPPSKSHTELQLLREVVAGGDRPSVCRVKDTGVFYIYIYL
jgi:hypothetical protein